MGFKIVAASLCVAPLLIAASQPLRLQPSSPWDVDYAENSCRLIRVFGSGNSQTKLAFESSSPDDMDMLVTGRPLSTFDQSVSARFLPDGTNTFDGTVVQTTAGDPAIIWPTVQLYPDEMVAKFKARRDQRLKNPAVRPPAISLAEQAADKAQRQAFAEDTNELEIITRRNRPVILETGSLGDAIKAFDQCNEDSLKSWGVDPAVEAKIVRPVWAENPTQWLFADDYPMAMAMYRRESQVEVRLLIDATGKVTKCTSLSHYNEPDFNRVTCDLIVKRAKFEPAELADGTKVPSYYAQRVIFRMDH